MVFLQLNNNDEASILQQINDTLNDPDEDYIMVWGGPISSAVASAIEKLLLSTKHQKRWRVELIKCWLEDEGERSILARAFYKAFSQGRIGRFTLKGLDSTNERGRDMLLAVFGTSSLNNGSQHSPMSLDVCYCIFDHTMMPHLQAWARDAATVSKLTICGDCFVWPDTPTTIECIAKMFEQAREKPTNLLLKNVSLIRDIKCLRGWKLESLRIEGSSQVRTLSGLSSMAPTLKELDTHLCSSHFVDISLADMDMGIIALLEDPNCCLEDLKLSSERVENTFTLALFEALSNVQLLKCLDISGIVVDNPSIWHAMLDYLRSNPPTLTDLSVDDSIISEIPLPADDICDVLRSENNTLEKFPLCEYGRSENGELNASVLPYLVRNRAGRRILLDEQVPPSLMAEVLGRAQQMEVKYFYHTYFEEYDVLVCDRLLWTQKRKKESEVLRADVMYHLVREGLALLFS